MTHERADEVADDFLDFSEFFWISRRNFLDFSAKFFEVTQLERLWVKGRGLVVRVGAAGSGVEGLVGLGVRAGGLEVGALELGS